jgi:2-polyprenyl-3-methyl-5-hydroxy-6-metoxy-1,4-benzoquinol methylase
MRKPGVKISSIGAIWKNRMNREAVYSTAEYWDSKAKEYAGQAVSMWPNNNLNRHYDRETISVITSYLPDVRGMTVLDVGCGTGRVSRHLAERGAEVTGIDFSARSIDIAEGQSAADNPRYRTQSVFELEDRDAYDVAVSWGSITFACGNRADLAEVMARLRAALKPGGKVLLLEPVHKGFLHRVLNMDVGEFCEVMEEAGFKVEDVTNLHFWPTRLALAYLPWPKFITTRGYYLGQWIMAAFGNRAFGDYKAIHATVSRSQ